jgi:uncharacterized protein (TIGR03118 family)
MRRHLSNKRRGGMAAGIAVIAALLASFALAALPASAGPANVFSVHNLVSDQAGEADVVDPNLVNAWGIAHGPTTPWWVADNETDVSTLYTGAGAPIPLVVSVDGGPTGIVFNGGSSFIVRSGHASGPALFLFATEAGTIRGWNPVVPGPTPPTSTQSFVVVDRSHQGSNYKGLAIASTAHGDMLYAADFHNGRVDMFDGSFKLVTPPGAFVDPRLPPHFAPFGIQNLGGRIYVAYAMQDEEAEDEVAGPGLGVVSVFDTSGNFLGRIASGGDLNAPWGLTLAPHGFGPFGGAVLVGNFGDGHITAFRLTATGHAVDEGQLQTAEHRPLEIDGLWGIGFGNNSLAGPSSTLFFAAGPDDEEHGLFGLIKAG